MDWTSKDPQPGAVVDGGELVVALARTFDRLDELDVDLDGEPRQGLLVALPAPRVGLVAL